MFFKRKVHSLSSIRTKFSRTFVLISVTHIVLKFLKLIFQQKNKISKLIIYITYSKWYSWSTIIDGIFLEKYLVDIWTHVFIKCLKFAFYVKKNWNDYLMYIGFFLIIKLHFFSNNNNWHYYCNNILILRIYYIFINIYFINIY